MYRHTNQQFDAEVSALLDHHHHDHLLTRCYQLVVCFGHHPSRAGEDRRVGLQRQLAVEAHEACLQVRVGNRVGNDAGTRLSPGAVEIFGDRRRRGTVLHVA